jgi:hypothetical protein
LKIEQIENELQILREEKIKGIIIRSKAKWSKDGEKCTKYFCCLEKNNFLDKSIKKVTLADGTILTGTKDIMNAQREFYQKLYAS